MSGVRRGFAGRCGLVLAGILAVSSACAHDYLHTTIDVVRKDGFVVKPGQRVAVLTFAGDHGGAITDLLAIELMRKGIDVVDRDALDRVVGEVRRAEDGSYVTDMTEQDLFARIGRIVGADVVVFGQIIASAPQVAPRLGLQGRFLLKRKDVGDESPVFDAAVSIVSLRAFSATTGEVVWWSTAETAVAAQKGDTVRLMDYLRLSARNVSWALTDAAVKYDDREFDNEPIPR
jgi:hypothetical protein